MIIIQRTKSFRQIDFDLAAFMDIVFLLLIFFMVVTTFTVQSHIQINLPNTSHTPKGAPQALLIQIDANGMTYFNQNPMSVEAIHEKLSQEKLKQIHPKLMIIADNNTYHGMVVKMMDIAYQEGLSDISIATNQKD